MADDPRYGPHAQTPAQRAYVLAQLKSANPRPFQNLTPRAQALHERYVAGELTWEQVRQALDAAIG